MLSWVQLMGAGSHLLRPVLILLPISQFVQVRVLGKGGTPTSLSKELFEMAGVSQAKEGLEDLTPWPPYSPLSSAQLISFLHLSEGRESHPAPVPRDLPSHCSALSWCGIISPAGLFGLTPNRHHGRSMCSGVTHLLLEGDVGEGMVVEVVAFGGQQINERADSAVVRQSVLQLRGFLEQLGGMHGGTEKRGQASRVQALFLWPEALGGCLWLAKVLPIPT